MNNGTNATQHDVVQRNMTSSADVWTPPCSRKLEELAVGIVISALIVVSNLVCVVKVASSSPAHHPQNRYFVTNLAIANALCGAALLTSSAFGVATPSWTGDELTTLCNFWSPVYIVCVMGPYVAVAALGFDVALYCHRSMHYHRVMSPARLWAGIASSWAYTVVVVAAVVAVTRVRVDCANRNSEMSICFVLFPILLMCLPAAVVIVLFVAILRRHWRKSTNLTPNLSLASRHSTLQQQQQAIDGGVAAAAAKHVAVTQQPHHQQTFSKSGLLRRFCAKFFHLIVFSIVCGLLYTSLTVAEVVLEVKQHERVCMIYRIDRILVSINSLVCPWIYCFATKRHRKKFRRRLNSWMVGKKSAGETTGNNNQLPAS